MRGLIFLGMYCYGHSNLIITIKLTYVFFSDVRIGAKGCLFEASNDSLWIALGILILCESRTYSDKRDYIDKLAHLVLFHKVAIALILTRSVQHARSRKNSLSIPSSQHP